MAFPDSRFDFRLELALGADLTDSPLEWDWTDFSDRIRQSTLSMPRGRPSEGSQVAPSQLAFDLDNVDGAVTPNLGSSPFYPFIRKGTPVRYWAEGATPGLILDGSTGTGAWTAAHADFDFAGDFEIRARIRPDQWAGARLAQTRQAVARKAGSTAGNQSFAVELAGTGTPATRVNYSGAGLTEPNGTNRVDGRVADTRARWVGWVWDHENVGGIGYAVAYSWPAHAGDPPADITDWDLVAQSGDTVTTTRAAASSTAVVELGMANGNSSFRGVIERVEFRDGVNGTLVADPDFTDPADVGAATVTDSFGKVWTLTGSAEIGTRRLRFAGSIVDLSVQWPLGDNRHSAPDGGSECWTSVVAGASIYHINQGSDPIRSALFRKITTNSLATAYLFDYWPMEVGSQAALAPSALGLDSMTLSGFTSTDSTILSSEPLPSIGGGQECAWYAPATAALFLDNWGCSFVFRFTDPDSAYRRVMAVETAGTAARWEVLFSSSGFRIRAVNGAESQLFSTDEANPVADTYAGWWVCYLRVQQSAGNMLWQFDALPWNDPSAITADTSGTTAGTVGAPTAVGTDTATPSGTTFSVGHVALYESLDSGPNWTVGWLDLAANAWIGETAAGRFARLCWEENIPGEVLGDHLTYTEGLDTVGDLDLSEPMGPQLPGPLLEVLRRCAALDGGLILERSTSPGLIYRTRAHIEAAQAVVALAVDGDVHAGLRPGLQFTLDHYRYRNSWNVKADNGGLATVSDATEIAKEGTVSDTVTVNSIGGVALGYLDTTRPELSPLVLSALDAVAARLVAASIVTEPRIARLAIELSASPELIAAWQDLAGGDRVTVSNLPAGQWAATDVDLTVEGTKETWSPTGWLVELACSPTAAWTSPNSPNSLDGFTSLIFDDFATTGTYDGGAFGGNWEAYDSVGNAGNGLRRTTAVSIVNSTTQPLLAGDPPLSNGTAAQIAATWDGSDITSGIVQLTAEPILYGRVRFRTKATGDPSAQVSPVVLMWPDDDDWPGGGEIDIAEGIDAMDDLNPMKSFLHRENPASPGNDQQLPALVWALPDIAYDAAGTDWHTYELVWLPDQLIITVDDSQTQTMTLDPAWIPSVPMKFSIQLDAWGNSALSGPVYMWVDWVSVERADFEPLEPLAIVGAPEWEYDTAAATVTNPDPVANGNTVLAIAFGQGTANAPTITVVPPPGVTATELTGLAVTTANIRLRAWTYPNDGAGSKTFGYSGGADNRSACTLIPLDGVATVIIEGGTPIVGNGPVVAFPSVSTEPDDLVIPFAGRRANSETPGSLGGFFVIDDDTAAAVNPQGAAWFAVTASTPTTTPPSLTWSGSANTHAQAVVAFRGEGSGGGGGLFPAAAQVNTADLTIDMQAVDSSTWGKDAEGQKILGGGRFNTGADDNIGSLVWESDDETINSFAMQDGETERIKVSTAKGLTVVETATQYVVDGSYEIPDAGNSFQGYVDSPPSDRLFFDGSRSSWSHIALGHTVGPAASPIVMGGSFIVQPWMLANDNTSGPLDLHAPTAGQTGPIANYCSNGQLYLSGKYSLTPVDPDSTSNLPVGWQSNQSIDLAAIGVGNWCTQVVEFVVDPGGIGYYNWYGLNHSTGEMLLVEARGNDWGWIFDEADPGYTDENDNFYLILPAQYHFHQYQPTGATENWDAAGASAAGAAFPNVRRAQWRWYASSQAVTAAQLMGHGKWSLGIT